jgi:hypothetical protein
MVNFKSIERIMLKQLALPKESQHVSIKQQNGKVQDEFEKKGGRGGGRARKE